MPGSHVPIYTKGKLVIGKPLSAKLFVLLWVWYYLRLFSIRGLSVLLVFALTMVLGAQTIEIRPTSVITLPTPTDSNSPGHWWNGNFVLFNAMGTPYRSEGVDQFNLSGSAEVVVEEGPGSLWIESTWMDDDGTLFAWYHHEPGGLCADNYLTAPKIGAMVSHDNGRTFQNLGFVLESGDPIDCSAENGYFAGGNGDFTVIPDSSHTYFYFLFSTYAGDVSNQGVAVARMAFADRFNPQGMVWKYYKGGFSEPGLGGLVSPILPANVSWSKPDADAFWGPSVHWNTALNQFVMLLNHSCCSPGWPQEGIYLSMNPDIGNPGGWSAPLKILNSWETGWYPQVIGQDPNGTDKLAGAVSRLYVGGYSWAEMVVTDGSVPPPDPDSQSLSSLHMRVPLGRPATTGFSEGGGSK